MEEEAKQPWQDLTYVNQAEVTSVITFGAGNAF
jgi:hypothetical protein